MSQKKFVSFNGFVTYMQDCYQSVADTCQSLFGKYNVSATESEKTEMCDAPLNLYNNILNESFQNMNDGANALECYLQRLDNRDHCVDNYYFTNDAANVVQNAYAEGLLAHSLGSANSILPYTEFASVYCPDTACKQEMFSLTRQATSECSGYIRFGNEDFTSSAASLSGNVALLFTGAHLLGQAIGWVGDYLTKSDDQNACDENIHSHSTAPKLK